MIRQLSLLTGLAIFGVVLNHSAGIGFIAMFWWAHRYTAVVSPNFDRMGSLTYFFLRAVEQLGMFAVPAFLFVSGYFAAYSTDMHRRARAWHIVLVRIKYLIIPYVLWSGMAFLGDFAVGDRYSGMHYVGSLLTGGASPPLYFVPVIIQCYLISPLIVPIAATRWKLLLTLSAVAQLGYQLLSYPGALGYNANWLEQAGRMLPNWMFVGFFLWFCLGIVARLHYRSVPDWLVRAKWHVLVATFVLFAVGLLEWELILYLSPEIWLGTARTFLDELYSLAFIALILSFRNVRFAWCRQLNALGTKSYGIYLSHFLILLFASKLVYHVAPVLLAHQLLYQIVLVSFGLGVPLLLMHFLEHSRGSQYYRLVFG